MPQSLLFLMPSTTTGHCQRKKDLGKEIAKERKKSRDTLELQKNFTDSQETFVI